MEAEAIRLTPVSRMMRRIAAATGRCPRFVVTVGSNRCIVGLRGYRQGNRDGSAAGVLGSGRAVERQGARRCLDRNAARDQSEGPGAAGLGRV